MNKTKRILFALAIAVTLVAGTALAEEPAKLALRQAVALAIQNSPDLALARVQYTVAEKTAGLERSNFLPNLYTGSGAAYTNGFPQTPGGAPPSPFNLSYVQTLLNPPLRGQFRAAQERAEIQRVEVDRTRDAVIAETVLAYLELAKARHSLELRRRQRQSAQKILDVSRERSSAGLELAIEVTRAKLSAARIEQRIAQLEGREEELEGKLHKLTGIPPGQPLEVEAEQLPLGPEQPVYELIEIAMAQNPELQQAEHERRAREHRLRGERGGYWPSLDVVGQYAVFSRINNFDEFFRTFRRHNLNVGVEIRIPVFSSRTSAAVSLARSELNVAELQLRRKRTELEIEVRRLARRARELDAQREVARLELQLAQENLAVLQARFEEGRTSLRDLERARLEESDKWMAFLDADYDRQQAQLELLKTTGQLARVFQ